MILLSILIATIESRKDKFDKLYNELNNQINQFGLAKEIEIKYYSDNKEISVGSKRDFLLKSAIGKFISYIDDDDEISKTYCNDIVQAIKENQSADCVGFLIECNMEGKIEQAIASNRYNDWCENKDGFRYCRTIYHKTPVKRDIALKVGFEDVRFAEDYKYAMGLKKTGLLKNEIFLNSILYYYKYKYENPKTKYGL